jgi:hypothetical protein
VSPQEVDGAVQAIALELRQLQPGGLWVVVQLVAVALPQHPKEHDVRIPLREPLFVEPGEVVVDRLCPQLVVPGQHLADDVRLVLAEGQVRRTGKHTVVVGLDHERLAVEEPALEAANLDLAGPEPVNHPLDELIVVAVEVHEVAVRCHVLGVAPQGIANPTTAILRRQRVVAQRSQATDVGGDIRLCPEKQPDGCRLLQLVCEEPEPARVEVGRRERQGWWLLRVVDPMLPVPGECRGHGVARTVGGDLRSRVHHDQFLRCCCTLARAGRSRSWRLSSHTSGSWWSVRPYRSEARASISATASSRSGWSSAANAGQPPRSPTAPSVARNAASWIAR